MYLNLQINIYYYYITLIKFCSDHFYSFCPAVYNEFTI